MNAEEEIRRVLAAYVRALDDRDVEAYIALFARDARLYSRDVENIGHEGIRVHITKFCEEAMPGWRTRHFLGSPLIDVHGDTADVLTDVVVFQCMEESHWGIQQAARYRDKFKVEDGAWRFAERRIESETYFLQRSAGVTGDTE